LAQIARPNSDISVGSWSPYPVDPTTLFDKIDEETPNGDADYIVSDIDEDECEFGLNGIIDPGVGTDHVIRCYAKSPNGSGAKEQMYIALIENGTVRGQSPAVNVDRTAYGLIEYALSEAEANAISNYPNLRLRFHITKVNGGEPIQITQAEFRCPDAATEFVYAGDIPLTVLPDAPKASLSKSYAGDVLLSVLPGYSSILEKLYSGDIPMIVLPSYSSMLEKAYGGDIGLALLPDSIYELVGEGAGEFVYAGDIPLIALPSCVSILERVYQGDIPLSILPDFPKAFLDKSYSGNLPLSIKPDVIKALLEKFYYGDISLAVMMDSLYSLEGLLEFVYGGDIPLSVLPGHSSVLDRIYNGDIGLSVIPTSDYELKALIEVVKTVFLKSRLTERLHELKAPIKPSIVLDSEIRPEGGK